MTTALPGCLSAHASRPSQVSACIVNRLCPLWGIHVTDFWDDSVSLRVCEGQIGWAIMGVYLSLAGLNKLECVTDLHLDLVQKKKIPLQVIHYFTPKLSARAVQVKCVCVCMFLVVSHTHTHPAAGPWHSSTPSASNWDHLHIPRMSTVWPIWTAALPIRLP